MSIFYNECELVLKRWGAWATIKGDSPEAERADRRTTSKRAATAGVMASSLPGRPRVRRNCLALSPVKKCGCGEASKCAVCVCQCVLRSWNYGPCVLCAVTAGTGGSGTGVPNMERCLVTSCVWRGNQGWWMGCVLDLLRSYGAETQDCEPLRFSTARALAPYVPLGGKESPHLFDQEINFHCRCFFGSEPQWFIIVFLCTAVHTFIIIFIIIIYFLLCRVWKAFSFNCRIITSYLKYYWHKRDKTLFF